MSKKLGYIVGPRMRAAVLGAVDKWLADGQSDQEITFGAGWNESVFEVRISNRQAAVYRLLGDDKLGRSPRSTGAGAAADILKEIK